MKKVTKVFAFLILLWLILAFFAPYNNVAGVAVLIAVIVSGIVFILMPYVTVRLGIGFMWWLPTFLRQRNKKTG